MVCGDARGKELYAISAYLKFRDDVLKLLLGASHNQGKLPEV